MKNYANKPTSSTCNVIDSQKKRIENLFTRFAVYYGHLWRSQFKSEGFLEFSKKEWLDGLTNFNDEILNQAIIECRDFFEMPPSLPQLINICRGIKKRHKVYVDSEEIEKASKEVVEANLKQCKALLNTQG